MKATIFFWNAQFHEFSVKTINSIYSCLSFSNTQIQEFSVKATNFFFWNTQFHEFSVKTINFIHSCLSTTPKFRNFPWKQLIFFLKHSISRIFREENQFTISEKSPELTCKRLILQSLIFLFHLHSMDPRIQHYIKS